MIAQLGKTTLDGVASFGDLCRFSGQALQWSLPSLFRRQSVRMLLPQLHHVGTRSILVVMVTGVFVGAVLAVQSIVQFRSLGLESRMGAVVNLSVLRELGPVLAGVMLAGRVGGGLTAELGTMRVTEQIDALRAMGADPVRVLVVPRFLACVFMIPILVIYANAMGMLGGYVVSVHVYGVDAVAFWQYTHVERFDLFYGLIKSVLFGASISLICCFKGFRCAPGAAGVGRACTESFVFSTLALLTIDFFSGMLLNAVYEEMYGTASVF